MEYFSSVVSAPVARVEQLEMDGLSAAARASIVTIDTGTAAPMDFSPSPDMQAWLRDRGCAAASAYAIHAEAMRERRAAQGGMGDSSSSNSRGRRRRRRKSAGDRLLRSD